MFSRYHWILLLFLVLVLALVIAIVIVFLKALYFQNLNNFFVDEFARNL